MRVIRYAANAKEMAMTESELLRELHTRVWEISDDEQFSAALKGSRRDEARN